jgi:hypothetical protein
MKTARRPGLLLPVSMIASFLASSSAPTPLYATYADRLRSSPITTTTVFGAYAVVVLAALLVLGRASDPADLMRAAHQDVRRAPCTNP